MKNFKLAIAAMAFIAFGYQATAQHLHVHERWSECSFKLDPSLTQDNWRQFTKEAGAVIYFRPLTDAKPMGARRFEAALLQWSTAIDDKKDAWNDTFVHPDSTHWLKEGPRLPIPGLTFRAGLTNKLDVAVYWTKSPGANYGFYGAQAQYNLLNNTEKRWSTSARANFMRMYGPEDLNLTSYGIDLLTSKEFVVHARWLTLAPYAGLSSYLSASHEKSAVVDLENERVIALQAMVGAVAKISFARIAFEYNLANVNTVSLKVGAAF